MKADEGTELFKGYSRAWILRLRCSHMSICMQGPLLKRLHKIMNVRHKTRTGDFWDI